MSGRLADGTAWSAAVPASWNGVLVSDADLFDRPEDRGFDAWCLGAGMAIARTSREVTQWCVGRAIDNRAEVHGAIERRFGRPERVLVTGASLGGLVTRALMEQGAGLADAGVAMNGGGAGTVGLWNIKLDAAFALDVLLAGDADRAPGAVAGRLRDPAHIGALVTRARQSAAGRARLVLAAALARQPVWSDPERPEPVPDDLRALADGMTSTLDLALAPAIRAAVEAEAGGVFSWNTDVDYAALVAGAGDRRAVVAQAYADAGLDPDDDVAALDAAPRIAADPAALAWAADNRIWSGQLSGPVVTMYAIGDPAAVPEEEAAYARTVARAGRTELLQQLFLRAAGHCRYTTGEQAVAVRAALDALDGRTGHQSAAGRNRCADEIDEHLATEHGAPLRPAAFFDFRPEEFPRPFDRFDARAVEEPVLSERRT
jgi:hypothetical protein